MRILKDINLFCLLSGKIAYYKKVNFIINPQLGISIYTIGNGKLIGIYSKNYFNKKLYNKFNISYNIYFKSFNIFYNIEIVNNGDNKKREMEIGFSRYF